MQIQDLFRVKPRVFEYFLNIMHSQCSDTSFSLNFARDRNESGAKRSMRTDLSLLEKFSPISSDLDPPKLDRSSLEMIRCTAQIHGLSATDEIYAFSLEYLGHVNDFVELLLPSLISRYGMY